MSAAWVCHPRRIGAPVTGRPGGDVVPLAEAVRRVLRTPDPPLGDDADVVAAVISQSEDLTNQRRDR